MTKDSSHIEVCKILTEFLDVAVHNVLKLREIYPNTIFIRKQKYGVVVYQAIHSQLEEYISNCMQAIFEIAKDKQLEKMVLCFLKDHEILDKIVFDVTGLKNILDKDPYLLDTEKSFRSFFCRLHTLNEYLTPLSDDASFTLQIHTTESTGIAYMENPHFQHFPWMQINPSYSEFQGAQIIPLESGDNNFDNIEIYIERKI